MSFKVTLLRTRLGKRHRHRLDSTIEVLRLSGDPVEVTTKVAEPGPLIAMKAQVVMNRSVDKQGTHPLDIVRLTLDPETRPAALSQIGGVGDAMARDIGMHVDLWLVRRKMA